MTSPVRLQKARQAIADLVGVALAGRRLTVGRTILDYVVDQGARPVAGIFGGGHSSPELASLANGVFAHALDFDDTNHPLFGHPSCSIVPALFAVGEETSASAQNVVSRRGSRPVNATSRSRGLASAATGTGGSNPAVTRLSGVRVCLARPKT